jgi:F0F1-type ATP synthase assembly protein I
MSDGKNNNTNNNGKRTFNLTLAAVASQVGCLTIFVVFAALIAGLWLDTYFKTRPLFTVGLMIASIPITLIIMFWIVKRATSRIESNTEQDNNSPEMEDTKSG